MAKQILTSFMNGPLSTFTRCNLVESHATLPCGLIQFFLSKLFSAWHFYWIIENGQQKAPLCSAEEEKWTFCWYTQLVDIVLEVNSVSNHNNAYMIFSEKYNYFFKSPKNVPPVFVFWIFTGFLFTWNITQFQNILFRIVFGQWENCITLFKKKWPLQRNENWNNIS